MTEVLVRLAEQFSVFELISYKKWNDFMDNLADPRTKNMFGVTSIFYPIIFGLAYVHFVKVHITELLEKFHTYILLHR